MAEFDDLETPGERAVDLNHEVEEWLEDLQKADQMFYNLMSVEIWSIAQTMDELNPGFWGHYMRNRQAIVQQQIQERQSLESRPPIEPVTRKPPVRRPSPFDQTLKRQLLDEATSERISLFSQDLEQALPIVRQSVRPGMVPTPTEAEAGAEASVPLQATPDEGTALEGDSFSPSAFLEDEIQLVEPTAAPEVFNPPPEKSGIAGILVELPHLMRVPTLRLLPPTTAPVPGRMDVSIACWLSRHFLLPAAEGNGLCLKRQPGVAIAPGQSVICRLGFQLVGLVAPVRVTLAGALQGEPKLTAAWMPTVALASGEAASPLEAAVQVTNSGSQVRHLQAGQPFCTLELTCQMNSALPPLS